MQEVVGPLHVGQHELPQPGAHRELLDDSESQLLTDNEKKGDGDVVVALDKKSSQELGLSYWLKWFGPGLQICKF